MLSNPKRRKRTNEVFFIAYKKEVGEFVYNEGKRNIQGIEKSIYGKFGVEIRRQKLQYWKEQYDKGLFDEVLNQSMSNVVPAKFLKVEELLVKYIYIRMERYKHDTCGLSYTQRSWQSKRIYIDGTQR